MPHKTVGTALLLATSLVLSSTSVLAADPVMLSNTCAGCHGTNGASVGPASPTIAGMSKTTIVDAMKGYKSGERPSTIMGRLARGYTDKEFEAMGEFFSKQKYVAAEQTIDAGKVKKGAKLHDKYCDKCHEKGGLIDDDGTSILAGQWMPYLTFSMEDFTSGVREMPKKMKSKLDKMVEKEGQAGIESVIHFYGSQK